MDTLTQQPITDMIGPMSWSGSTITATGPYGAVSVNPQQFPNFQMYGLLAGTYNLVFKLQGHVINYSFTVTANSQYNHSSLLVPVPIIKASASTGGTISSLGAYLIPNGGNQGYTIKANTGYDINQVLVDGNALSFQSAPVNSYSYTFTNVTGAHTIAASFTPITYTITGTVGAGSGTVMWQSGPTLNPSSVNAGTVVIFRATPYSGSPTIGSIFGSWSGVTCTDTTGQTGTTCTVPINSNTNAIANFIFTYSVFYSVGGAGSGTLSCSGIAGCSSCSGNCVVNAPAGTQVTFTATPAGQSSFSSWGGACAGVGTTSSPYTCQVTVNPMTGVSASFAPLLAPAITTQPKNQTIDYGDPVTFTAAASGNPVPTYQWQVSTNHGYTFTPISGATGETYTIKSTTRSENGYQYECVATNSQGTATTLPATLKTESPTSTT
jgi:hypothetical protein